jgi:hypothetical protein
VKAGSEIDPFSELNKPCLNKTVGHNNFDHTSLLERTISFNIFTIGLQIYLSLWHELRFNIIIHQ